MVFIKEDIIQFNWENGGCWYDGYKIDTINPDGTYNLLYGTTIEENIPESLLRGFEAKCIAEIKTLETDKIKLDNKIELLRAKLELFHSESVDKEAPLTIDAVEAVLKFTLILSDELPYDYAEGTARTEVLNMAERLLWARQKSALTNGQAASKEHLEKAQSLYEQAVDLYHSSYEAKKNYDALLTSAIASFKDAKYENLLRDISSACTGYSRIARLNPVIVEAEFVTNMGALLTATRRVVDELKAEGQSDPSLLTDLEAAIKPLLPPLPLTYVSEQVIDESEPTEGKTYILKLECETPEMYTSNSVKFINSAGDILFQLYSMGGNNSGGYGEIHIGSDVSGQKEEIVLGWEFARQSTPTLRTIDVTEEGFEYTMPSDTELTTKYLFKHRAPFNLNDYRVEYDNVTYKDVTNSSVTGTVTR